ncbi:MAG: PAS domain-containing protein [Pseudanabaena sp. Salubria-1]|nr:PAS domain-containing protein [Pseudanabaena sp. Salubria-1]
MDNLDETKFNEAILRLFYDLPFIGMAITSPETMRWVRFNDRLCEILGYSRDELPQITWMEITHPDDLELDVAEFERVMRGEAEGYVMDKRFIHKDGSVIYASIDVKCVRKEDRTIDFFITTVQDISDRKRAEARQKQTEQALAESEERYRQVMQAQAETALQRLNEELEIRIEQRTADLQQSEARSLAIINALPDLILLLKPDGTCIQCIIPSTDDKSKYIPIQHHISEVLSPEDLQAQLRIYEIAIATGEVQIYEHQLTKSGKTVYEEVRIAPYCKDELLVIVRDITDRKKTEQHLQNATDRLTLALKSAAIGIWEWDITHNSLVWDERTEELYGLKPDEFPEAFNFWVSRVHPSDREFAASEVHLAINGEKDYEPEFRIVLPDGRIRCLKAYGLVQRDNENEPQRLIGINFDITDRKLAEEHLLKSDTHLKTAQRIGKLGSWEFEVNTGKLTWSDEVFRIYGLEPSANPPDYEQLRLFIHPEDWQNFDQTVQAAMSLEQSYDLEHRIIQPNGTLIYVMARGEMIYNVSGQLTHIIGTAIDITDRKLAEAQILHTANQLANTNRELESFSYSVSHDLRAPLRHMNGFVNALHQRLKAHEALQDPKVTHYLQVIEKSSQKMGHLIDGLLMLSRFGRRPLESKQISIRDLVDEAIEIIRTDPHHNHLVEFAIGDLPTTVGDHTLLQQVFLNLIGNAVKFSRNHPQPYVEIDSLQDQTIRIRDNGVGFQMEYADKLFGAFQRLHNDSEFEGTGIGLAIVQRIVQRHGGSIWAEGYPDQGATFFIKL